MRLIYGLYRVFSSTYTGKSLRFCRCNGFILHTKLCSRKTVYGAISLDTALPKFHLWVTIERDVKYRLYMNKKAMPSQGNRAMPPSSEIAPFDPPTLKTLPENDTWSGSDNPLRRYGHSKFSITKGAFGTPILREWEVVWGHRSYHWKEQWCFPIRSPLWPLRSP